MRVPKILVSFIAVASITLVGCVGAVADSNTVVEKEPTKQYYPIIGDGFIGGGTTDTKHFASVNVDNKVAIFNLKDVTIDSNVKSLVGACVYGYATDNDRLKGSIKRCPSDKSE